MNFDLRLPIGFMFSVFGIMLTVFGFMTRGSEIYSHSLGKNINLGWGLVLLVFGAFMLFLARKSSKSPANNQSASAEKPAEKPGNSPH